MRRATITVVLACSIGVFAPTAAGAASSQTAAQKVLVTTADLPAGWTATPHDSTGDSATAKDIAECVGKPLAKKQVSVKGDDITDASGNFMATSAVSVYASAAVARKQFRVYESPKYGACAKKHFETTPVGGTGGPLPTSVNVGKVKLARYGQRTVAYGASADIPDPSGTTTTVTSIQAAILKGRGIVTAQFNGKGDVFAQDQGVAVLAAINKRLKNTSL
jgi:hypothetical protein